MLLFFGNLINQFFGKTASSVMSAAKAKLQRETVGKWQAKASGAESRMRQQALRGVSNIGSNRGRQQ